MPTPKVPPTRIILTQILAKLGDIEADVEALKEDQERIANYQRLAYESTHGADPSSEGIWDGTDRYT